MSEVETAWAAGLFEGEGGWYAYVRPTGKVQMQARLGMTDRDVVEHFAAVVGCGTVKRSQSNRSNEKPMWTWSVYEAERVRRVIALFLPYMGERRRARALEVLDVGAGVQSHNAVKTHCPKGHELAGDNLKAEPIRGGAYMARRCRTCRNAQERERMRARKSRAGLVTINQEGRM